MHILNIFKIWLIPLLRPVVISCSSIDQNYFSVFSFNADLVFHCCWYKCYTFVFPSCTCVSSSAYKVSCTCLFWFGFSCMISCKLGFPAVKWVQTGSISRDVPSQTRTRGLRHSSASIQMKLVPYLLYPFSDQIKSHLDFFSSFYLYENVCIACQASTLLSGSRTKQEEVCSISQPE